jgi:carboxypeptidase C (cathepsin A)
MWMAHVRFKADVMHRSSDLLIPVIEDGIRVLIYAGVNDLMCNFIGNEVSRTWPSFCAERNVDRPLPL